MTDVISDLEELIRQDLVDRLGPDPSGEIAGMSLSDVLIVYLNWRGRFIPVRPRTIHVSRELGTAAKYREHGPALDAIVAKIEAGDDLTPHLSKRIRTPYQPTSGRTANRGERQDLDLLVAEWNIHHLHLSTVVGADGFVGRTQDLLFANFQPNDAYLIAIYAHRDWTRAELGLISIRNWPDAGIFQKLNGVLGLVEPVADTDRLALRKSGVTTLLEFDGAVYAPAGQTTAGTPIAATMWSGQVIRTLRILRETLNNREQLARVFQDAGSALPANASWKAHREDGWYGLRETHSGIFLQAVRIAE